LENLECATRQNQLRQKSAHHCDELRRNVTPILTDAD
jgi:hypothetical protein